MTTRAKPQPLPDHARPLFAYILRSQPEAERSTLYGRIDVLGSVIMQGLRYTSPNATGHTRLFSREDLTFPGEQHRTVLTTMLARMATVGLLASHGKIARGTTMYAPLPLLTDAAHTYNNLFVHASAAHMPGRGDLTLTAVRKQALSADEFLRSVGSSAHIDHPEVRTFRGLAALAAHAGALHAIHNDMRDYVREAPGTASWPPEVTVQQAA